MSYYLAIDIGASSGRHIIGWLEGGKFLTREVYRFENRPETRDGELCWDIEALYGHVLTGMKECKKQGLIPRSLGIDTWGVDFVLLDRDKKRLGNAVCYRDHRTTGMDGEVEKIISFDELYRRTGIAKQPFNTIYQLTALKRRKPELLEKARSFLLTPNYLHYRLTGIETNEYTNATTTALVDARKKTWDLELIDKLGINSALFTPLSRAGDRIGSLSPAVAEEAGFNCEICLPATHDTGSAFLAVPAADSRSVYISSGTWSLLGIENSVPLITAEGQANNFTNEGGYEYRYRFLKNIMGLWMIQSVRNELEKKYSFGELEKAAQEAADFDVTVDVNNVEFLSPENMGAALQRVCKAEGKIPPGNLNETMQCLYRSLAVSYRDAILSMEQITGKKFNTVNLVGGGSKDRYLNRLTAEICGLPVYAGPVEATVIGNLIVQMISGGELANLDEARQIVGRSFEISSAI
jgi:rhamnulokinase